MSNYGKLDLEDIPSKPYMISLDVAYTEGNNGSDLGGLCDAIELATEAWFALNSGTPLVSTKVCLSR